MTPEKARELLDGDFKTETRTELVGDVQAETVAGLRYEYALQVEVKPGLWQYVHQSGEPTGLGTSAAWARREGLAAQQRVVERYRGNPRRIVRRYVSEPEEVQL